MFRNADDEEIAGDTVITRDVVGELSCGHGRRRRPLRPIDAQSDVLTYTIGDANAALFDIDRATGQIMVGAGTMLDFDVEATSVLHR